MATDFTLNSCREFVEVLASNAPVPGGGGAAALVGAIGTALGNMVGSLTVGKKKYAAVEEDIQALMKRAEELSAELLSSSDCPVAVRMQLSSVIPSIGTASAFPPTLSRSSARACFLLSAEPVLSGSSMTSSTKEFHAPQRGHRPAHLIDSYSQDEHI